MIRFIIEASSFDISMSSCLSSKNYKEASVLSHSFLDEVIIFYLTHRHGCVKFAVRVVISYVRPFSRVLFAC